MGRPEGVLCRPQRGEQGQAAGLDEFETTRYQYVGEQPERLARLYPPEGWHLDWERLSRPGIIEIQFKIFSDYGSHIRRFPEIRAYHREQQPPCLLLWGRHDPFLDINEIMAYNRVLDALEIHVLESGHQLLETHHRECAALIARFVLDADVGA
jgi:pimeloyl-ACP methyl ester carboxylesterase